MLNFLKQIWSVISTIFTLLVNVIKGAIQIIGMIPQIIGYITMSFAALPPYVVGMATLMLSLIVVYFVNKTVRG